MSETRRDALPRNTETGPSRIGAVLRGDRFGFRYRGQRIADGRRVIIDEYFPSGIASRAADGLTLWAVEGQEVAFETGAGLFRAEITTLATIDHPGIVPVEAPVDALGTVFMIQMPAPGACLGELLMRQPVLAEGSVMHILDPLFEALEVLHEAGLIHCDLSPDAIWLRADGTSWLTGFGATRQALGVHTGSVVGFVTPGYAAPELYRSDGRPDVRTDVYGLGAALYRTITGAPPTDAPGRMRTTAAGGADPMRPASEAVAGRCSREFLEAIDQALSLDPGDRPADMETLRRMLRGEQPSLFATPAAAPETEAEEAAGVETATEEEEARAETTAEPEAGEAEPFEGELEPEPVELELEPEPVEPEPVPEPDAGLAELVEAELEPEPGAVELEPEPVEVDLEPEPEPETEILAARDLAEARASDPGAAAMALARRVAETAARRALEAEALRHMQEAAREAAKREARIRAATAEQAAAGAPPPKLGGGGETNDSATTGALVPPARSVQLAKTGLPAVRDVPEPLHPGALLAGVLAIISFLALVTLYIEDRYQRDVVAHQEALAEAAGVQEQANPAAGTDDDPAPVEESARETETGESADEAAARQQAEREAGQLAGEQVRRQAGIEARRQAGEAIRRHENEQAWQAAQEEAARRTAGIVAGRDTGDTDTATIASAVEIPPAVDPGATVTAADVAAAGEAASPDPAATATAPDDPPATGAAAVADAEASEAADPDPELLEQEASLPEPEDNGPDLAPVEERIWVAKQVANVRSAPTTASLIVGRLRTGQRLTVLGRHPDGNWLRVVCDGCEGEAWVWEDLVQPAPNGETQTAAMPRMAYEDILGSWCVHGSMTLTLTRTGATTMTADGGIRSDIVLRYRFFEDTIWIYGTNSAGDIWVSEFGRFEDDTMVYRRWRSGDSNEWRNANILYLRC